MLGAELSHAMLYVKEILLRFAMCSVAQSHGGPRASRTRSPHPHPLPRAMRERETVGARIIGWAGLQRTDRLRLRAAGRAEPTNVGNLCAARRLQGKRPCVSPLTKGGLQRGRAAARQPPPDPLLRKGVSINARSPFDGLKVSGKSAMKSNRDPLVLSSAKHERRLFQRALSARRAVPPRPATRAAAGR